MYPCCLCFGYLGLELEISGESFTLECSWDPAYGEGQTQDGAEGEASWDSCLTEDSSRAREDLLAIHHWRWPHGTSWGIVWRDRQLGAFYLHHSKAWEQLLVLKWDLRLDHSGYSTSPCMEKGTWLVIRETLLSWCGALGERTAAAAALCEWSVDVPAKGFYDVQWLWAFSPSSSQNPIP